MTGDEYVMIWAGRFISYYSRVRIRARKVCMFRAHTWEMLRAGRYVASGSHVLDYGRVGP